MSTAAPTDSQPPMGGDDDQVFDKSINVDEDPEGVPTDTKMSWETDERAGATGTSTTAEKEGGSGIGFRNVLSSTSKIPMSLSYGNKGEQSNNKENADYELQEDIYTLFFIAPFTCKSHAMYYSVFFFLFQMATIVLILYDLLDDGNANNWLNVPPAVDPAVSASQVFALVIAVITQNDVITTLYLVSIGYDRDQVPPSASRKKWIIANILRFVLGMSIVFLCFVFIVQSTTVIDLFKDFAAVTFVADIDDAAFYLARLGFISDELREATKSVEEIHFTARDDTVKIGVSSGSLPSGTTQRCCSKLPSVAVRFRQIIMFAVFGAMVGSWGYIYSRQKNGDFFVRSMLVELGDETFGSLQYAFFSGVYELDKNTMVGRRPIYYERGALSKGESGKFFYCMDEEAWVFSVTGVTKGGDREDDCHWLLRSPNTGGYELTKESLDGWKIWTGKVQAANNFRLANADCDGESDCNYHGSCSNGSCECDDGWLGKFCSFEDRVCDTLTFYIQDNVIQNFTLLEDDSGEVILAYERPVYYWRNSEDNFVGVVLYTGRRWFVAIWDESDGSLDDLRLALSDSFFHAHWSQLYAKSTYIFSDPTESLLPVGESLKWDMVGSSRARGDFGTFGFWDSVQFTKMHCDVVDCTVSQVCGKFGICQNGTCICEDGHKGHFCQYPFIPDLQEVSNVIVDDEL